VGFCSRCIVAIRIAAAKSACFIPFISRGGNPMALTNNWITKARAVARAVARSSDGSNLEGVSQWIAALNKYRSGAKINSLNFTTVSELFLGNL
jgi:hypothetical protein